jgi:transposase
MGKSYRPYYPDEELLLPPSLREWMPEDHLAYFVGDVIDQLDLSAMDDVYGNEKRGQPPYNPRMMTKLLVYAYCVGVFSSRRIERRLVEDIAFRVLAAENQPNFRTISDFRKIHLKTLEGLFEQVLKIALEAGVMKVGRVAMEQRIEGYIATERQKHGEYKEPCPRGPLPANASRVDRMRRKLKTKPGRLVYAVRKTIVEPVFGQIKQARGFRQFLLRGIEKVRGEWSLVCLTHNILKCYRLCYL